MKNVLVLGASGSLGTQVVNYLSKEKGYIIQAITGWHNTKKIEAMSKKLNCQWAHKHSKNEVCSLIASKRWDLIVNCVSGLAGVELSWLAVRKTKRFVLGNKETLFINGKSFLKIHNDVDIVPLDSELTSLWYMKKILKIKSSRLFITASGGSIFSEEDLNTSTRSTILNHPVWKMGEQITIDSSTMINKLFELYSVCTYFDVNLSNIDVYICRSGYIHAGLQNEKMVSLNYKPTMEKAIDLIFGSNQLRDSLIKDIDMSILENVDTKMYPLYELKENIFSTMKNRTLLLSLSLSLGRDFILNKLSFLEMIKRTRFFFKTL